MLHFCHVGRELNQVADWARNVARQLRGYVECTQLCIGLRLFGAPPGTAEEAAKKLGLPGAQLMIWERQHGWGSARTSIGQDRREGCEVCGEAVLPVMGG